MSHLIGKRLGQYEVTAPIGEGGMGQVYRVCDTRLARDGAFVERFKREANTAHDDFTLLATLVD